MAGISTGVYTIVNASHSNLTASVEQLNPGTPLTAQQSGPLSKWKVELMSNGRYIIKNEDGEIYANVPAGANLGVDIAGQPNTCEWKINVIPQITYHYTISNDSGLVWGLDRNSVITLKDDAKDLNNQWKLVPISGVPQPSSGITDSLFQWWTALSRLNPGEYTIRNVLTNSQWALWQFSEPTWKVAPLWLFTGSHQNPERRFTVEHDPRTFATSIVSRWNPAGPVRYLSVGPNFRPERNLCRLYGVPLTDDQFFICTDMTTDPPLVLQDGQGQPLVDNVLPITVPLDPGNLAQRWRFTPVRT